jgi:thiol-disulfide isomerase/thioredoxin
MVDNVSSGSPGVRRCGGALRAYPVRMRSNTTHVRTRGRRLVTAALTALVAAVLLAACSGGAATDAPSGAAGDVPAVDGAGSAGDARSLQGLEVVQAAVIGVGGNAERPTDEVFSVDLQDPRPVLVWAWSPNCSTCNITAPSVERFAQDNAAEVRVVGLGTQSDEKAARAFVERHRLRTPQMLWDPSFATWDYLGLAGQPAGRLFSPDGTLVGEWFGPIPEDDVLADVRALAAASATTLPAETPPAGG